MNEKTKPNYMLSGRGELTNKDTVGLKVNGWIQTYHSATRHKKAGLALLISDKVDFRTK